MFYELYCFLRRLLRPLSSVPSPAPALSVSTQSGRCNEDHEYREAAQDHPHYSEPDGRPPRFQCEFKVKPPVALQHKRADCTEAAADKVRCIIRVIEFTYTGSVRLCQQNAVKKLQDKCPGWLLSLRSMPTSWLMESSMQPSCSSSKTPSGSLLLIMKALSTCLVRPSRNTLAFHFFFTNSVWTFCGCPFQIDSI